MGISGQWSVTYVRFEIVFSDSYRGALSFYTQPPLNTEYCHPTTGHWPLTVATDRLMPITAYISLGSNLGDRAGNLLLGIRGILSAGHEVTRLSQIYETEPMETFPQPNFLNIPHSTELLPKLCFHGKERV